MPQHEGGPVALFIDWDNLAISTAADHSGALPDLRRILQVAQGYGTVLVARAYAEWGVTSDRLMVYKAGIEPVYAPTFRFEADQPGQPGRGKSLADPCLVADCIDIMHLHPQLSTLLLVSGDKDLIPIVRLAQLRGKRVVVIGPDLVAAVLKDMADEYIPYRSLLGAPGERSAAVRAEAAELGRRRRRRGRGGRSADETDHLTDGPAGPTLGDVAEIEALPPPPTPRPPRTTRERRPFADRAGVLRPREPGAPEPQPAEPTAPPPPTPAEEAAPAEAARREPITPEPARETAPLEPAAPEPAEERAEIAAGAEGDRSELFGVIASILKERTSAGRPRLRATNLKDYLLARMPGFAERRYGFGRFADLLAAAESAGVLSITDVGHVQWISLPGAGPAEEPARPSAAAAPAAPVAEAKPPIEIEEAIEAIAELRHRGRLLTNNYVVSTLAAMVTARAPQLSAADEARRTLDRLVEAGAVRVDQEPSEVEWNGARHRVRLVHLVEAHEAVRRAETAWQERAAAATPPEPGVQASATEAAPTTDAAPAVEESAAPTEEKRGTRRRRGRGGKAEAAPSETAASEGGATEAAATEAAPAGEAPTAAATGEEQDGKLAGVFDVLIGAVREAIPPGRDTAGAAGVKQRLTQALGSFNERDYGFTKFKDFLLAAEKAGRVRVESSGAATRVGLPAETA